LELLNLKSYFNNNKYFNKSYVQFLAISMATNPTFFIKKEKMHGKHEKGAHLARRGWTSPPHHWV
jgi:hypothetical protein